MFHLGALLSFFAPFSRGTSKAEERLTVPTNRLRAVFCCYVALTQPSREDRISISAGGFGMLPRCIFLFMLSAIRAISGTIERLSEISSTIAAAVEEQGAATQEISRR